MIKIKTIVALLLFVSCFKLTAQEFKLGKVTVAELQEKVHPKDSSAAAAILYNKGKTFFRYDAKNGFSIITEYFFRIKIYKKEGLSWGNYKVPFRIGYENLNDDRVEFSDGVTYNLENGTLLKTKLKSEGVFKTVINKYWKEAAIAMPNVKVGSIIEFQYILKSENIVEFPDFNFQYEIPVNYSECITEIPGFFVYKAVTKGGIEISTESKIVSGSLNFANQHIPTRTESVSFSQVNSKYVVKDLKALKEEPFVDNIQNYRVSIFHELEKTQFYQEPVKDYSQTWKGVAKTIYEDKDFGAELNESQYIVKDLVNIIKNEASKTEKMEVIFKFVQNKMNWNGKKGYYTDKGVKQAYIDGTGNTAEINFILMAMLNRADIKAEPVLICTTDNGIPVYPSRTVFNYLLAAVEIDGKQILLDATNKNTTQNILPLNTLNWIGRLIKSDGTSQEIEMAPKILSKNRVDMKAVIDANGKISGRLRRQITDYEAFVFRGSKAGMNKENYLEQMESYLNGIQISNYSVDNGSDFSKPIVENFNFESDNHCEIIGSKMYINPLLFFTQHKNPFVQETRDFPIYFGYPKQEKYNVSIEIPDGYAVESIPKILKIATGENVGLFIFNITAEEKVIQVSVTKEINSLIVSSAFYDVLKDFFQQMIQKQTEKIVLKKI